MYYLGDDASGEKKKKGKKNRKGAAPEVEAAPEPELTEYMKQSYAGNASRPVIKGEDDDSSEEEYASEYQDAGRGGAVRAQSFRERHARRSRDVRPARAARERGGHADGGGVPDV